MAAAKPLLVDLKIKRKPEMTKMSQPEMPRDEYPYGMKLDFGKEILTKMGTDLTKVRINQPVMIHGMGKVSEVRQSSSSDGYNSKNLTVQLTKVARPV